ncbi:MAG: 7-cyano-7-deazaguanine synthase QueC [Candidatus Omnitrophica bacterium]|nr:7-cyano-7-deazaguanine synthase QueC [Candidatus Omnitrophota bacterium]
MKKAVVLLSGGLDSAVTLYLAKKSGYKCLCLGFDYGQRHLRELICARSLAKKAGAEFQLIKFGMPWKGSALLDKDIGVTRFKVQGTSKIPNTYVPARNIIFLSFALSYAEAIGAGKIFIGAHAQDYSGYPDCRPEFYDAFARVVKTGTKAGVENRAIKIETPLLYKFKSDIINLGMHLKVPFELTWSCYKGGAKPCGKCDSCFFRQRGFKEAGVLDPAI